MTVATFTPLLNSKGEDTSAGVYTSNIVPFLLYDVSTSADILAMNGMCYIGLHPVTGKSEFFWLAGHGLARFLEKVVGRDADLASISRYIGNLMSGSSCNSELWYDAWNTSKKHCRVQQVLGLRQRAAGSELLGILTEGRIFGMPTNVQNGFGASRSFFNEAAGVGMARLSRAYGHNDARAVGMTNAGFATDADLCVGAAVLQFKLQTWEAFYDKFVAEIPDSEQPEVQAEMAIARPLALNALRMIDPNHHRVYPILRIDNDGTIGQIRPTSEVEHTAFMGESFKHVEAYGSTITLSFQIDSTVCVDINVPWAYRNNSLDANTKFSSGQYVSTGSAPLAAPVLTSKRFSPMASIDGVPIQNICGALAGAYVTGAVAKVGKATVAEFAGRHAATISSGSAAINPLVVGNAAENGNVKGVAPSEMFLSSLDRGQPAGGLAVAIATNSIGKNRNRFTYSDFRSMACGVPLNESSLLSTGFYAYPNALELIYGEVGAVLDLGVVADTVVG